MRRDLVKLDLDNVVNERRVAGAKEVIYVSQSGRSRCSKIMQHGKHDFRLTSRDDQRTLICLAVCTFSHFRHSVIVSSRIVEARSCQIRVDEQFVFPQWLR